MRIKLNRKKDQLVIREIISRTMDCEFIDVYNRFNSPIYSCTPRRAAFAITEGLGIKL